MGHLGWAIAFFAMSVSVMTKERLEGGRRLREGAAWMGQRRHGGARAWDTDAQRC